MYHFLYKYITRTAYLEPSPIEMLKVYSNGGIALLLSSLGAVNDVYAMDEKGQRTIQ